MTTLLALLAFFELRVGNCDQLCPDPKEPSYRDDNIVDLAALAEQGYTSTTKL